MYRAAFRMELKGVKSNFYKQRGAQEFWCAIIIQYPKISRGAKDQQGGG